MAMKSSCKTVVLNRVLEYFQCIFKLILTVKGVMSFSMFVNFKYFVCIDTLNLLIKDKQRDKDEKVKLKSDSDKTSKKVEANSEKPSKKKDASASNSCAKVHNCITPILEKMHLMHTANIYVFLLVQNKVGDKDEKAKLKSLGAKAVEEKDYAAATKFYSEVNCCGIVCLPTRENSVCSIFLVNHRLWHGCVTDCACCEFCLMQAIKVDPADAALYSNRSLCHLKSGKAQDALVDANAAIRSLI